MNTCCQVQGASMSCVLSKQAWNFHRGRSVCGRAATRGTEQLRMQGLQGEEGKGMARAYGVEGRVSFKAWLVVRSQHSEERVRIPLQPARGEQSQRCAHHTPHHTIVTIHSSRLTVPHTRVYQSHDPQSVTGARKQSRLGRCSKEGSQTHTVPPSAAAGSGARGRGRGRHGALT